MGRVWRARDEVLHRDVAIKELVPPPGLTDDERREMRERSLREARAIARLNHINVVRIFDVLRTDGDPWIVMEYVPSRSLQAVIATEGRLPPARVAEIGLGMLAALRAAHRAGVVHRDIKPANVLLADDGRVVLTDWGLATMPGDPTVTRTGLVLGSPAYIAPERARDGTAGPRSDMWSLGATLYAAVEGQSPFARPSALATLAALATEPPAPARKAGPLRPVLNGLLRKDPAERIGPDEADRLLRRAAGRRPVTRRPLLDGVRRPNALRDRPALGSSAVPGPRQPGDAPASRPDGLPAAPASPAPPGAGVWPISPAAATPPPTVAPRSPAAPPPPTAPAPTSPAPPASTAGKASGRAPAPPSAAPTSPAASPWPRDGQPVVIPGTPPQAPGTPPEAPGTPPQAPGAQPEAGPAPAPAPPTEDAPAAGNHPSTSSPAAPDSPEAPPAEDPSGTPPPAAADDANADGVPPAPTPAAGSDPDPAAPATRETPDPSQPSADPTPAAPVHTAAAAKTSDPHGTDDATDPEASATRPVPTPTTPPKRRTAGTFAATGGPAPSAAPTDPAHRRHHDGGDWTAQPTTVVPPPPTRTGPRRTDIRTRSLAVLAGALAAVVLMMTVLLVLLRDDGDDDAHRAAAPGPSTTAQSTPPPTPSATQATRTTQPTATASAGFTLPQGWRMRDDGTGFRVPVPETWTFSRDDGGRARWTEPGGARFLLIDQTRQPKADPRQDWLNNEAARRGGYRDYRRVRLVSVDYWLKAADWEFTYTSRSGNRLHVLNRGFVTRSDQAYSIYWSTTEDRWAASRDDLEVILEGFKPARS